MRIEGSVMTSLAELRVIEEQRMAAERAARIADETARVQAIERAAHAAAAAEAARVAEERAAALAIESARENAEREARMRVEAAQAAERARHQASLDEARLAQEMEIAREIAKRTRPKWMVVVTVGAVLAASALTWFAVDRMRAASESDRVAEQARATADANKQAIRELDAQLVALNTESAANTTRLNKAIDDVMKAEGAAAIAAGKKKLLAEQAEQAAIAKRKADIKRKLDDEIRKRPVTISDECKHAAIGKKGC